MSRETPRARRGGRHLALTLGVLALATACHRKAPGPEECLDFAYRAVGVQSDRELAVPSIAKRVNEITTECLVTPYDRELVACVEQGLGARRCMRDFEVRHGGRETEAPLRTPDRRRELPFP
jgi:hypothetical protein